MITVADCVFVVQLSADFKSCNRDKGKKHYLSPLCVRPLWKTPSIYMLSSLASLAAIMEVDELAQCKKQGCVNLDYSGIEEVGRVVEMLFGRLVETKEGWTC